MNEKIHLTCGDCLEVMKQMPAACVDMVLCDLPYGNTRNSWDKQIDMVALWEQYGRIVKPAGAIVLFGSGRFTAELMQSNARDWRYNLIWEKTTPTGFLNAKRMPLRCHEDILVFYRELPTYHPIMSRGVRKVSTAAHKRNSKSGSSYGKLDNCMGSGSTAIACLNSGRRFEGIEINPDMFAIAEYRILSVEGLK